MSDSRECGSDVAAYVLGALDPSEVESFRRHLDTCSICREEMISMQELADALPETTERLHVSRRLRRQILSEVHADAQRRAPARAATRSFSFAPATGRPRMALALGVVALGVAVVVGAQIGKSGGHGMRVYAASVGRASLQVTDGRGELIVHQLPRPSGTNIYEVWLERPGGQPQATSALFNVTSAGRAAAAVPGQLSRGETVLVTQEPAHGSPHPTSGVVIAATVS